MSEIDEAVKLFEQIKAMVKHGMISFKPNDLGGLHLGQKWINNVEEFLEKHQHKKEDVSNG